MSNNPKRLIVLLAALACAAVVIALFAGHSGSLLKPAAPVTASSPVSPFGRPPGPPVPLTPASTPKPPSPEIAQKEKTFATFKRHPFTATKKSGADQWTAEDGKDPDVILQLAHNELEAERLMNENSRIKKRELVYRTQTVPQLLDQARNSGQALKNFTLPGVDGQEVNVEVLETHFIAASNGGSIIGRVDGQFGSMATVGFSNGYESYNIIDPAENIYIAADAREPGEVMVKQIDPDQYSPALGNGSEKDNDPVGAPLPKQTSNIPPQFLKP